LARLGREEGATPFMVLLAGFKTWLYRFTGQDDIVLGTPIAGRNQAELEGLIGCFSNTLVLRTNLAGAPTFCELVRRVREELLEAFSNQDVPFEKLVEELKPKRAIYRTPLFQINFRLVTAPQPPPTISELTLEILEIDNGMSKFDLSVEFHLDAHGLAGYFEY